MVGGHLLVVISSFYLPLIIVGSGRHGGQKVGSRVSSLLARDLARNTAARLQLAPGGSY